MLNIVRWLAEAPVVVADLTGASANVYYEIGIAHAFRRPVLAFIAEGEGAKFDLAEHRAIRVYLNERGDVTDKEALQDRVRDALTALQSESVSPATAVDAYLDSRDLALLQHQRASPSTEQLRVAALRGWLRPLRPSELDAGVRVVHVDFGVGVVDKHLRETAGSTISVVYDDGASISQRIEPGREDVGLFRAPW